MEIYNTLTKKLEPLPSPDKQKNLNMFVCGPTVYDYIHIGNARTFVFFDVVAKYLKHRYGNENVKYIQNITDIDNKIIERAQKEGVDPLEYAKKYSDIFKKDMEALGVTSPEYKNATDHIPEVIKQVQTLLNKGNAYVIENDGIYFDLSTFPEYGKLSGRTAGMANDAVSRIDDSDKKRNRGDFAIWKFSKPGEPGWEADFGKEGQTKGQQKTTSTLGRPGWHIEDTAITEQYFGPQYDIHGGGQDLIFPHHEAEIAQQESASGLKPFVKYWMHVAFLVNHVKSPDGDHVAGKTQKMSKSIGNFETVHELLQTYPKEVLRFYLLSSHYRSPLDFSDKNLKQSEAGVSRIYEFAQKLSLASGNGKDSARRDILEENRKKFLEVMDDDLNIPKALATIFDMIRGLNTLANQDLLDENYLENIKEFLSEVDSILGIIPLKQEKVPDDIIKLVEKREELRKEENWVEADKTRTQLKESGWEVEDTIYGPIATFKS